MTRVIVIGAGIFGLVIAKTYLELEPDIDLTIIDSQTTVGGVWSKERLYPQLYAQIVHPLFEYHDFPMENPQLSPDGYINGESISSYLNKYAIRFRLMPHIRFSTWASNITQNSDGTWSVILTNAGASSVGSIFSYDKLIVATGPASKPHIPDFAQGSSVSFPLFHSKDLGEAAKVIQRECVKNVVVVGGSKSAFDSVVVATSAGKRVQWIVRPGRGGPLTIFPSRMFGLSSIAIASTRLFSKLSPCCYSASDMWYSLFQKSILGARLTKLFWFITTKMNNWHASYHRNMEVLRPRPDDAFWCNGGLGCASHPQFWNLIHSGLVTVYEDEVEKLQDHEMFLKSGMRLNPDLTILCTGWEDELSYFSAETMQELGLPGTEPAAGEESIETTITTQLTERFPLLRGSQNDTPAKIRRWRLYRRIVPASHAKKADHSLVVLGEIHTISTMMLSGVQALWAVSYLRKELTLPTSEDAIDKEIATFNVWARLRYLTIGKRLPYAIYDFLPYIDILCHDLGINPFRKPNLIAEFLQPYGPRDYTDMVNERRQIVKLRKAQKL